MSNAKAQTISQKVTEALKAPSQMTTAILDSTGNRLIVILPISQDENGDFPLTKSGKSRTIARTPGWGVVGGVFELNGVNRPLHVSVNAYA